MSDDLLSDLAVAEKLAVATQPGAADLYRRAREEIERCHERLEIDHVFQLAPHSLERCVGFDTISVKLPYADRLTMIDGIAARDATIQMLEEDKEKALSGSEGKGSGSSRPAAALTARDSDGNDRTKPTKPDAHAASHAEYKGLAPVCGGKSQAGL